MRRGIAVVLASTTLALTSACGTIIHGSEQEIGFRSAPERATVKVDNLPIGQTPIVHKLARKSQHVVQFELAGYEPYSMQISRKASGWVWGNIVFGGLVGLVVDASTGGMYKLTPEQVFGQMSQPTQAGEKRTGDAGFTQEGIYVSVVLRANPNWQKVGQMERE